VSHFEIGVVRRVYERMEIGDRLKGAIPLLRGGAAAPITKHNATSS